MRLRYTLSFYFKLRFFTRAGVLQLEVLIGELGSVDGLATSAVVVGEVATLAHEVGNNSVEGGAPEAEALLAGAESPEVLSGLGDDIGAQLQKRQLNEC